MQQKRKKLKDWCKVIVLIEVLIFVLFVVLFKTNKIAISQLYIMFILIGLVTAFSFAFNILKLNIDEIERINRILLSRSFDNPLQVVPLKPDGIERLKKLGDDVRLYVFLDSNEIDYVNIISRNDDEKLDNLFDKVKKVELFEKYKLLNDI